MTNAPPKDREVEADRKRELAAKRFAPPSTAGMKLTRHDSAEGFLAHAGEFLGAREAEHNLILGLSSRLRARR